MIRNLLFGFSLLILFASCEKEDSAYTLPPPGDLQSMVAAMGNNYENQVFVDLSTGEQVTRSYKLYDIALEASPDGWRLYLNTAKFMFLANTGDTSFADADSMNVTWKTETDHLYDDSTAFGDWRAAATLGASEVFIIDRGRAEHFGADRWRKLKVIAGDQGSYTLQFCNYNNTSLTTYTVTKDPNYSLMYFSFSGGGQQVQVAPPKNRWDLVFTKYIHTYYSEPPESPYRFYMVCGALLNRWSDARNAIVKQDSTIGYIPFEEVKATDMITYSFYKEAAIIGYDWKDFDFNLGYTLLLNRYYLVLDPAGYYYKLRFYDFYDDLGNKGAASFEYQRL
jgi:hypothetical protein